ncbi:MAG: hypothetical protein OXG78_01105 [Chloroflexi bacterium]|nr:hypothetical protein [Chloroflexota bacterium]
MENELPPFRRVKKRFAASIIQNVLSGPRGCALLKLHEYEDGHYRAVFAASHFDLPAGRMLPSKSQWNTLKKRLKRRDHSLFIFRDYGAIDCDKAGISMRNQTCLFIDFGFMPD